jgi:hypothetical protein
MSDDQALRNALLTNRQRHGGSSQVTSPTKPSSIDTRQDDDIRDDVDTGTKFHKRARLGATAAAAASISAWGNSNSVANQDSSTNHHVAMATAPVDPPMRSIPGPAGGNAPIEGNVVVSATTTNATSSGVSANGNAATSTVSATPSRRSQRRRSESAGAAPTSGLAAEMETAGDKVFRRGAWLALLEARQLAPFGAAPLIARSATLANVQRDGAWKKAPRLAVFVHRITLTETDAIVVARDPTGQMMGTVHRSVLDDHPAAHRGRRARLETCACVCARRAPSLSQYHAREHRARLSRVGAAGQSQHSAARRSAERLCGRCARGCGSAARHRAGVSHNASSRWR